MTSVKDRVLSEVNDWMSAVEIAEMLGRNINGVKGSLAGMAQKGEIEERGTKNTRQYRNNRVASREIMSKPLSCPQWIHKLEVMERGWV